MTAVMSNKTAAVLTEVKATYVQFKKKTGEVTTYMCKHLLKQKL
jgi:hypothetical protein